MARWSVGLAILAAVSLAAAKCGGSGGTGGTGGASGSNGSGGGSGSDGSGTAGTTGNGGTGSGGGSGGTGAAGGTGAGGGSTVTSGGGGSASGGSIEPTGGGVPESGAWATGERLDDAAECDGLVPDRLPAPVRFTWSSPVDLVSHCLGGISDGTGHVVAWAEETSGRVLQVFGPDGPVGSSFHGDSTTPPVPQASGWTVLGVSAAQDPSAILRAVRVVHRTIAPDATITSEATVSGDPARVDNRSWSLAEDPAGGSLAMVAEVDRLNDHGTALTGQRFDASGAALWPAARILVGTLPAGPADDFFLASGISTAGASLSAWASNGAVSLAWRDRGGSVVAQASDRETVEAVLGSNGQQPSSGVELHPLLDGSLALRAAGAYRRVFSHLATTSSPLPQWLAGRSSWSFRVTRGGRGYVLLPPAGQGDGPYSDCMQRLELIARSGRRCGQITLHAVHGNGFCSPGTVDQGWDGTVVQQLAPGHCFYVLWPRMLAP
jgi:hypothetical protein